MNTYEQIAVWDGCERGVFALAVRGDVLLCGGGNATMKVLDLHDGKCLKVVNAHSGSVYCIVTIDDGRVITSSADHTVKVFHQTKKQIEYSIIHSQYVSRLFTTCY